MVKPEDIARACGVEFVEVVDPFDLKQATDVMERAIRFKGPSVVVSRRPCTIIDQRNKKKAGEETIIYHIDQERCDGKCEACIKLLGCPAITKDDGRTIIDDTLCTGCGLCVYTCPYHAIIKGVPE
jgi:indolepyruvate ferredoxin oxidoreductase alpha subunit